MDRREKKSEKDAMFDFVKDLPKNENGLNTSGAENVGATSTDYDKKLGELDLAYNKLKQLDLFGMSNGEEEYTGQGFSDKEYEGLLASAMSEFVVDLPKKQNGLDAFRIKNTGAASTDYDREFDERDLAYNKLKQMKLSGMSNGEEEYTGQGFNDKEYEGLLASAMTEFVVDLPKKQNGLDAFIAENIGASSTDYDRKFDEIDLAYNKLKQMKLSGDPDTYVNPMTEKYTKVAESSEYSEEDVNMKHIAKIMVDAVKNMPETAQDMQIGDGYLDLKNLGTVDIDEYDVPLEELVKMIVPPEDLARATEMNINPFIMQLMSMCLSKNVLYTPVKGLVLKFPEWLQRNRPTLSAAEYNMRVKQFELLKSMCSQYEKEDSNDSDEVKTERFKILMYLMHKVRCCGGPPTDLLEGIKLSPFRLDMRKMPNMGNVPDDDMCCLM